MFTYKTNQNLEEKYFTVLHQLKIFEGRYLLHIIRHDNITFRRVILFKMVLLLPGSLFLFICIIDWDDTAAQEIPRKSPMLLSEASSSLSNKRHHPYLRATREISHALQEKEAMHRKKKDFMWCGKGIMHTKKRNHAFQEKKVMHRKRRKPCIEKERYCALRERDLFIERKRSMHSKIKKSCIMVKKSWIAREESKYALRERDSCKARKR